MFLKELHSILPIFAEAPRGIQRMRASIKGSETRVVLWVGVVIWRCKSRSCLFYLWWEDENEVLEVHTFFIDFLFCSWRWMHGLGILAEMLQGRRNLAVNWRHVWTLVQVKSQSMHACVLNVKKYGITTLSFDCCFSLLCR